MPGIFGVIHLEAKTINSISNEMVLSQMCDRLMHYNHYQYDNWNNTSGKYGCVHSGIIQKETIRYFSKGVLIIFFGELYGANEFEFNYFDKILSAYEEFGENFLLELNGSFSVVLVDEAKDIIIIGTDRVSSKCVFYCIENNNFFFSPEIKALNQKFDPINEISFSSVGDLLTHGFILNNNTLSRRIREIPNGSYILIKNGNVTLKRYWDFLFDENVTIKSQSYYIDKLYDLLYMSIKRRDRKDIESATLLSGGVDSRAIVAIINELRKNQITINYGSVDDFLNNSDSHIAYKLSQAINSRHHFFKYDLKNYTSTLETVTYRSDGMARGLPEFEIYKKARVELGLHRLYSGDNDFGRFGYFMGNDEQVLEFGNYIRYFDRFKVNRFPLKENAIRKILKDSRENISEISKSIPLKEIHNRKDFLFLTSYMIPLIGKDRATILSELEIVNPWYDADILDFYKTVPIKYRKDKVLFKNTVAQRFPKLNSISSARTVTKPTKEEWDSWYNGNCNLILQNIKNLESKSDLFDFDNYNPCKPMDSIVSMSSRISAKALLPVRTRNNFINKSSYKWLYSLTSDLLSLALSVRNYLIFLGLMRKKQVILSNSQLLISIYRITIGLKNLKRLE